MMLRRFQSLCAVFILCVLVVPVASYAIDQRCWIKSACEKGDELIKGVFYKSDETKAACQMSEDPITKQQVGFCVAAGTAETKVDFGGKQSFAHIGDFIKWVYKYGVAVAGILAVVMIISAGFNWAISGGNTEKISAARKKIGGAMMGLFLAAMSYFILNTINPYLVNLRMPQVWKINVGGLSPAHCDQIKDSKKVSEKTKGPFNIDPTNTKNTQCGKKYYVENTPGLTCGGMSCPNNLFCSNEELKDTGKKDSGGEVIFDLVFLDAGKCLETGKFTVVYKMASTIQEIAVKVPVSGYLYGVVEAPEWFDRETGESHSIKECVKPDGKTYYKKYQLTSLGGVYYINRISTLNGKALLPFYQYKAYYNFDVRAGCDAGDKVKRFFIRHEIKEKNEIWHDAFMYISPTDASLGGDSLAVGNWDYIQTLPGFVPNAFDKINVFHGEASVTDDDIQAMVDKSGIEPNFE